MQAISFISNKKNVSSIMECYAHWHVRIEEKTVKLQYIFPNLTGGAVHLQLQQGEM
jgi:hypothetical protein